nr:MAG TPA: hypothetical protein [Caudoviricetes sp.]
MTIPPRCGVLNPLPFKDFLKRSKNTKKHE